MKEIKNKFYEEKKGITLIALVITIIVLLILAGVSIATLVGENGVIRKATTAREKTQEAEAVERVQTEVLGSYGEDGNIDIDKLNENLKNNITGLTYNEHSLSEDNKIEKFPAAVSLNGCNIVINGDGSAKYISEMAAKIIENPKEYYGKKVTNYKGSNDDTNTYRVFYVDATGEFEDKAGTIYLKADYSETTQQCQTTFDSNQTRVREMNPLWAKERGSIENWNNNEKASAWLCDPSQEEWKKYCDDEKANYAIGGPSIEMYVKSYNQTHDRDSNGNDALGCEYRETNSPGYIYKVKGEEQHNGYWTNSKTLDYTDYNNMYCEKNEGIQKFWWITSPCAGSTTRNGVCHVNNEGAYLDYDKYYCNYGVSPLVSLKSSFVPEIEN